MKEFESIGFYMSDHPLNIYKNYFQEAKISSFNDFIKNPVSNSLVSGTIMAIQEKKSAKGNPFAIIKFTDLKSEFELFIFSDLLIANRDKLKAANSFVMNLQKDTISERISTRRINVRSIIPLENFVKKTYDNVIIEINNKSNFEDLKNLLIENGDTKVKVKIRNENKTYLFSLKKQRKFNLSVLNSIKSKEYVKKISF